MISTESTWRRSALQLAGAFLLSIVLAACGGSDPEPNDTDSGGNGGGTTNPNNSNQDLTELRLGTNNIELIEGEAEVNVSVGIPVSDSDVSLTLEGDTEADLRNLEWQFDNPVLSAGETSTTLTLSATIASAPIEAQTRQLQVVATDSSESSMQAEVTIQLQPTPRPDIYLLAGQSNMVGYSQIDARQDGPGEPDAPNDRILQLNVTNNFSPNHFSSAADFSNPEQLYITSAPITTALDPLHQPLNGNDTKEEKLVGAGLSFAKRALADTTADIILVPAAWSDTGFCIRETYTFDGMGWNSDANNGSAFGGSLLYQRAVLRTNLAIELSGGVLRGILWHQGEADADSEVCANAYRDNLTAMVAAFRSDIAVDARGSTARGPAADIPFVVATMSKGSDERGSQTPFTPLKTIVDDVHRSVDQTISTSAFVNNDDLVPPAYPCGEGSCVHFGAAAYREMGARYYDALSSLVR